MSQQQKIQERLEAIQSRISTAEKAANRPAGCVTLIGASKKQTSALIRDCHSAGLSHCGENYLQEAIAKQTELDSTEITWHFIGQIQSNKTKAIANHFTWVHGIDRLKIASRLAQQHPHSSPIKLLIQVNVDEEPSKGGVILKEAGELACEIAQLGNAELRGFMAIPKARQDPSEQRSNFAKVYELLVRTNQKYGLGLDELSMGMSGDLEAAISEGATMVRIGTDLFGERK